MAMHQQTEPDFEVHYDDSYLRRRATAAPPLCYMAEYALIEEQLAIEQAWQARTYPDHKYKKHVHIQHPADKDYVCATVSDTGPYVFRVTPDYKVIHCSIIDDDPFGTARMLNEMNNGA